MINPNFLFLFFNVSPRTPSYMGQTDPVSVFPSQQPFRKDPRGCSRVGGAGDGDPDDPVASLFTPPITEMSETAPPACRPVLSSWWNNPTSSVLVSVQREERRFCIPVSFLRFTLVPRDDASDLCAVKTPQKKEPKPTCICDFLLEFQHVRNLFTQKADV